MRGGKKKTGDEKRKYKKRRGEEALESMRAYPEEKIRGPGCWFSLPLTVCLVWCGCSCLLKLISLFYLQESLLL